MSEVRDRVGCRREQTHPAHKQCPDVAKGRMFLIVFAHFLANANFITEIISINLVVPENDDNVF